jgi:hypothetical protein
MSMRKEVPGRDPLMPPLLFGAHAPMAILQTPLFDFAARRR